MTSTPDQSVNSCERRTSSIIEYAIAAISISLAALIGWYVCSRLNVGSDISDGAYYIISYAQHRDVEAQSTLAGWIWACLSPFEGILANRQLGAIFLVVCFSLLAAQASRDGAKKSKGVIIPVSFAVSGSLVYYIHWLPDPSYNSINLGFIALAWFGFLGLLAATNNLVVRPIEAAWSAIVGLSVASVLLAKPTSAILLGPILLVFYVATSFSQLSLRRLLVLGIGVAVGFSVPFVAFLGIGEGPIRAFWTMKLGAEAGVRIAPPPLSLLEPFFSYLRSTASSPILHQWFTWVAVTAVAIVSSDRLSLFLRLTRPMRLCITFGVFAGFPLLLLKFGSQSRSDQGINALLALMLALTVRGIFLLERDRRRFFALVAGAMCIAAPIYCYGTGNPWTFLVPTASGFMCVAFGATISGLSRLSQPFIALPGLGILVALLGGTALRIEGQPYRLASPLSSLQSPALVGALGEKLLESPSQAEFYNKLFQVRPLVAQLADRPYLIDLSGRAPMVTFQIGARAPRTPWLISGYRGSQEVFNLMVSGIPRQDVRRAWIFQARDYADRIPDAILKNYGVEFPGEYVPVVTVPLEYLGVEGTLYAPPGALNNDDVQKFKR